MNSGELYFFASQLLLERISWICRDAHSREKSGNGKVAMLFSRRATLDYSRFRQNAERIQRGESPYPSKASWDNVDLKAIRSRRHSDHCDGLLAADYVASAFGTALEANLYGLSDDHYVRPLAPRIYHPAHGTVWANGLKVFPSEAETLCESHPRMRWIESFFGYGKKARA